jgi:hypothetical protein
VLAKAKAIQVVTRGRANRHHRVIGLSGSFSPVGLGQTRVVSETIRPKVYGRTIGRTPDFTASDSQSPKPPQKHTGRG